SYGTLEELVHQEIKVEMQMRKRSSSRKSVATCSSWDGRDREKEKVRSNKSHKKGSDPFQGRKKIIVTPSPNVAKTSSIKCFKLLGKGHIASQCPNRRVMIVKDDGDSHGKTYTSSELEIRSDNSRVEGHLDGHLDGHEVDGCHVLGHLCSIIIDGGSCVNMASERLVGKLYRLQWLSEHGELVVNRQVEVAFTLGRYENKVLCDVVPMEATHLLLGRLW
ncbi:hypothetical protein CR513_55861, partial [Mucuna pruriens]